MNVNNYNPCDDAEALRFLAKALNELKDYAVMTAEYDLAAAFRDARDECLSVCAQLDWEEEEERLRKETNEKGKK